MLIQAHFVSRPVCSVACHACLCPRRPWLRPAGVIGKIKFGGMPKSKMENGKCVPLRSDSEASAELRIIAE